MLCVGVSIHYLEPAWLAAIGQWSGLTLFTGLFLIFNAIEKRASADLALHRGEVLLIDEKHLEFQQLSSGYTFKKSLEEIESVSLTQWFGVPSIKIRFRHNQFYQLRWFKDSPALYQVLKRQEAWLKSA
ncbi:hypothetical protein VII00023_08899 [Vibrio ichthyoenteri ATCC 700023]|uniref:Uncharacterized protein n=2 Tax=Vibrio ichthyoenteri TaxID=142461 RepID=F9S579_9VIBR|nr:hypothetical protein VII00023_08899 [Vibrio ichthyoenteri ATCC 700023]